VENTAKPSLLSSLAKSITPDLSETLTIARTKIPPISLTCFSQPLLDRLATELTNGIGGNPAGGPGIKLLDFSGRLQCRLVQAQISLADMP
jgi:hypothetical protein